MRIELHETKGCIEGRVNGKTVASFYGGSKRR